MKRILFFILILLIHPCLAQEIEPKEEMTPSMQANLFYADNNIKKTYEIIMKIPQMERTAQDWLLLGNILQDEDRISDAQFMYNRALIVDEKFYKAYYNLGNIHLDEEQPYMAIDNYKKAIKYNDKFAFAQYNLACAYIRVGQLKKAKNALLEAVVIDNTQPDFYYNLAYVYKKLGKEKAAKNYLQYYQKALDLKMEQ